MASAQALYYLFMNDSGNYEKDLAFIATLIQEIGYRNAKATLKAMFE